MPGSSAALKALTVVLSGTLLGGLTAAAALQPSTSAAQPSAPATAAAVAVSTNSELPATVSNVVVTRQSDRVVMLSFDSALLGLRAVTRVVLPSDYASTGPSFGVLYQLHGTRGNTALVDAALGQVEGQGLGTTDSPTAQSAERFLVVQPDAGPVGWCNSCWWVDGRNGQGVLAESHLLRELLPVVEVAFNVRRDRGGRAVYGTSMGGIGALIQAFRHPDLFGHVASQSGPESGAEHEDAVQLHQDGLYYGTYLVTQGYPDPVTNPAAYRNIDVVTLAPQVAGTGLRILLGANDGCLPPFDPEPQPVADDACLADPDPNQAFHMANEFGIRIDNEAMAARLLDLGIPFRLETEHGRHGIGTLYQRHVVPELNAAFRQTMPAPDVVAYKTTDRSFSVWGYDVSVERPNEEFVYLSGARLDGSELVVAGTGRARIRTPKGTVPPGREVVITVVRENAPAQRVAGVADEHGRVTVAIELGPLRTVEERRLLTRQGLLPSPRTHITVAPAGSSGPAMVGAV